MKKISAVVVACALAATCMGLVGCGERVSGTATVEADPEEVMGMPNPVHESDKEGVFLATGLPISAPLDATDAAYSFIDPTEDGDWIAQVDYKDANGVQWTYRIQALAQEAKDISGAYYDWKEVANGKVHGCQSYVYECEDGSLTTWYDDVAGINYSLFANQKLDPGVVITESSKIYEPVQGSVG